MGTVSGALWWESCESLGRGIVWKILGWVFGESLAFWDINWSWVTVVPLDIVKIEDNSDSFGMFLDQLLSNLSNIARGITEPEIDSVTWIELGNNMVGWFLFWWKLKFQFLHGFKLFHFVHRFRNTFCFRCRTTPSAVRNFFRLQWEFQWENDQNQ